MDDEAEAETDDNTFWLPERCVSTRSSPRIMATAKQVDAEPPRAAGEAAGQGRLPMRCEIVLCSATNRAADRWDSP